MYKLIINPLMVLAATELAFLSALPYPAHNLKWTSPQRNQINAMYYKFLGTNPNAVEILKIAKQQRWPSGEMKDTTSAQRAILDMLCVVNSRQTPEAIDLFETLIGWGALWVALLPYCYYIVNADTNRQLMRDTVFNEPAAKDFIAAATTAPRTSTPLENVDNILDFIKEAWSVTLQAHSGGKLTQEEVLKVAVYLRNNCDTLEEAKDMCNYAFSELGFFGALTSEVAPESDSNFRVLIQNIWEQVSSEPMPDSMMDATLTLVKNSHWQDDEELNGIIFGALSPAAPADQIDPARDSAPATTADAAHLEQQCKDAWERNGNTITAHWPNVYSVMRSLIIGHTFTTMLDWNNLLDNAAFVATEQLSNTIPDQD